MHEELDVLRAVADQQGAVLVTGIRKETMLADVQDRAGQSRAGGRCVYHARKENGSGTQME